MQSSGLGMFFSSKGFRKALNTRSQNVLKCLVIDVRRVQSGAKGLSSQMHSVEEILSHKQIFHAPSPQIDGAFINILYF